MASDYHTLDLTADLPLKPPAPGLVAIYGLFDPRDGRLRYIGKAVKPRQRWWMHQMPSRLVDTTVHRANWVKSVLRDGLAPQMHILAWVADSEWKEAERAFIAAARAAGCDLTNRSDGGDGGGIAHDEATRRRLGALSRKQWSDPEYRLKHDLAMAKVFADPEWQAQHSARISRLWQDPAFRSKNLGARVPSSLRRRGAGNCRHSLTWEQARDIRRRYAAGVRMPALAKEYGVGLSTVSRVVRGITYRDPVLDPTVPLKQLPLL